MTAARTTSQMGALRREVVGSMHERSIASPAVVYATLADPRTHAIWGGERQAKKTRLVEIHADEIPAVVGSEFTSKGTDPMGRFDDRSVVTDAEPDRLFAFVTEARLGTKKGDVVAWTVVHRYEIEARDTGSLITYTYRIARMSQTPGLLQLFNVPVLSSLLTKMSASVARRGFRNLARFAEGG